MKEIILKNTLYPLKPNILMREFNMIYIAIDGDDIHQKFEKCLLQNDETNISRTGTDITNTIDRIIDHLRHENLKIVFSAGDCILCKCDAVDLIDLSNYLEKIGNTNTVSVGIGDTLEKTYIAFKYARSVGKNSIVKYTSNNKLETFDLNTAVSHSSCFAEGLTPCPVE
mgnify:CR=1 FL=1